ncbi:MAG: rhodanese-like domain-containing protein [Oceanicoccus sp.]
MKTLTLIIVSWLLVLAAGCSTADSDAVITSEELMSRINDKSAPVILDVRSEQEFQSGHVPGAINVPFGDHQQLLSSLNLAKSSEVVVYCESGRRAGKMMNYMQQQGFFEVRHLQDDMRGWRKAALPSDSRVTPIENSD